MKLVTTITCSIATCVVVLAVHAAEKKPDVKNSAQIKQGEHLVKTIGCNDCHTPAKMGPNGPVPDLSRMLSGHPATDVLPPPPTLPPGPWMIVASGDVTAWSGPWGVSFTRNLTPDKETGLGDWTEQNFIDTIRSGKRLGKGRALLPPMPWEAFSHLTDDELKAIFAYLRTIPAVKNPVPEPMPPAAAQ